MDRLAAHRFPQFGENPDVLRERSDIAALLDRVAAAIGTFLATA